MNMMKCLIAPIVALMATLGLAVAAPEDDRKIFSQYFEKRFPAIPAGDHIDGAYVFDEDAREQWKDIEEFAPWEISVEEGEELFETPFANGKGYADCFDNGGIGIRQTYPRWDKTTGRVISLELAINVCREANGEAAYSWKKGELGMISAYMAYTSRDKTIDIIIPDDDPRALAAYQEGKRFFYTRRGQLNMNCSACHVGGANVRLRSELPSAALGHTSHFPVYRAKWGELGTLHRRYAGCNLQVRAQPFEAQSEQYRNLEYFHTFMSNGLLINGPGSRK